MAGLEHDHALAHTDLDDRRDQSSAQAVPAKRLRVEADLDDESLDQPGDGIARQCTLLGSPVRVEGTKDEPLADRCDAFSA